MRASTPYLISFAAPLITFLYATASSAAPEPMDGKMVVHGPIGGETNGEPVRTCNPQSDDLFAYQNDITRHINEVCESIPTSTYNKNQLSVYYASSANGLIVDFCISIPTISAGWPDSDSCKGHFLDLASGCKYKTNSASPSRNAGGGITENNGGMDSTWYNITISHNEVVTTGPSPLTLPRIPIIEKQMMKPDFAKGKEPTPTESEAEESTTKPEDEASTTKPEDEASTTKPEDEASTTKPTNPTLPARKFKA